MKAIPFLRLAITWSCDGCKCAASITVDRLTTVRTMAAYVAAAHREQSPACPRVAAALSAARSYWDAIKPNQATPHFDLIWRDGDELALTKEEKTGGPMLIIDPTGRPFLKK